MMRAFRGHRKFAQCAAFSPDGALLASSGADQTIRLWNVATGKVRHVLKGHANWVTGVAFSPRGDLLVSGGHDGTIRLWPLPRTKSQVPDRQIGAPGHKSVISCVTFAPDGSRFAWGCYNGSVSTCEPAENAQPSQLRDGGTMIYCVAFAPDSATLAIGGDDGSVELWDTSERKVRRRLAHHDEQGCRSLAYSPNGLALALALGSGAQVWAPGPEKRLASTTDHTAIVSATAYAPDGRLLLTGSWDGTVRLYDVDPATGAPLRQRACLDWRLGKLFDAAFAPDGMTAVCSGHEGDRVLMWDVE
jgi:WD40 repeat protein